MARDEGHERRQKFVGLRRAVGAVDDFGERQAGLLEECLTQNGREHSFEYVAEQVLAESGPAPFVADYESERGNVLDYLFSVVKT